METETDIYEPGKLFMANLQWETTETTLKDYFSKYGEVKDSVIIVDKETRLRRGIGFVAFTDHLVAETILNEEHFILGRKIDVQRAYPKEKGSHKNNKEDYQLQAEAEAQRTYQTKKIFVGGLPNNLTIEQFKAYFGKFGKITEGVIMHNKKTQNPKGFGFITFDSKESVENVTKTSHHELNDKIVEVKKARPNPRRNRNMIHTYDCNNVGLGLGLGFGGSAHRHGQYDNLTDLWYYPTCCLSCLVPFGYEHTDMCLYKGMGSGTVCYIHWRPRPSADHQHPIVAAPPPNGRPWNEEGVQTYVCSYEDPSQISYEDPSQI